jgi:histone deacetylase 1/2
MDDESYEGLFRPIMDSIMANYQPDAIVLQSGEHRPVSYIV